MYMKRIRETETQKNLKGPKGVQVMVDGKNTENVGQEGQENERSSWGITIQYGAAIIVPV